MKTISCEEYNKLPWFKKPFYSVIRHFTSVDEAYKAKPKKYIYNIILVTIILGVILWFALDVGTYDTNRNLNWEKLGNMIIGFFTPDLEYLFGYGSFTFQTSAIYETIQTFAIAFVGTLAASVLSLPFGFLASRKLMKKKAIFAELILILIRTFPEILFGFLIIKGVGFGAFAGVVVLSIHSIGMIGKMYSEQIDIIDDNPLEALSACGATTFSRIKLGVVPQVAPNFISVILYRFDLNIRTASMLGLVGAGGVGYSILQHSQNAHWHQLASVLYCIIILVLLIDFVSGRLRKKLV